MELPHRSLEQRLHMFGDFRVKGRSDVAIRVERERDGAVAEELLNDLRVHAPTKQMRGRGMPEIMNPDPRQTCLSEGTGTSGSARGRPLLRRVGTWRSSSGQS